LIKIQAFIYLSLLISAIAIEYGYLY